ncbi:helix-turn-helix domain-containing protein [Acinetobacter baumannii]|nr:helix-turn-helix domain-containing protein [Acinetobacter baumannii]
MKRSQKKHKIAELTAQGWSASQIADILNTPVRYVFAVRKKLREEAEERKTS